MTQTTESAARLDALGFVEQTIYANEDSDDSVVWRNSEVLALLVEIAERLRLWPAAYQPSPDSEPRG